MFNSSSSKLSAYSAICSPLILSSVGIIDSPYGTFKPASAAPLTAANTLAPLIGDYKPMSATAYSTPAATAFLPHKYAVK